MTNVTPAAQWKSQAREGEDLPLPSGNVAFIRRIKPEAFIQGGMIPSPLMPIIQQAIQSKKGLPPKTLEKIQADPEKLVSALEMFDRVLVYTVIEPKVSLPPVCKHCHQLPTDLAHMDNRDEGYHVYEDNQDRDHSKFVYTDEVDMEDKMFIFQRALGGAADIESFRDQLADGMVDLSTGKDVDNKAKRPARSR